jgi:hypothetical protein
MPMNQGSLSIGAATLMFEPAGAHVPLLIWNMLTNEAHGYNTVQDALMGRPFFDFNGWPPSIYGIYNYSTAALPVVMFERTYIVEPGSEWQFIAHDEIGTHIGFPLPGTQTRIIQSIWDTQVPGGPSIWDTQVPGGPSLWDISIEQ